MNQPDINDDDTSLHISQAPSELSDPGSLIASIPAVMGYYPTGGVVLFALYEGAMLLTTHYSPDPTTTNRAFAAIVAEGGLNFLGYRQPAATGPVRRPPAGRIRPQQARTRRVRRSVDRHRTTLVPVRQHRPRRPTTRP